MSRGPASRELTDRQRVAWLRLIRSENVGPVTFRELLNHAGSAERALELLPSLSARGGKRTIRVTPEHEARAEIEALESVGGRFRALGEEGYPPQLRRLDGAPPLVSVIGANACLASHATVAIVGARNASLAGQKIATEMAGELGRAGYTVVSGLARGIDTAAHRASLETGTIAVVAGGVDIIYPHENRDLYRAIIERGGAILSEMPFGWKPRGRDFPRRNRIISGISLGTVLVEAARASGSLHTARFAAEQNREVFAVPGSPLDPRSEGGNRLIRDGATLVTSAGDVLEGLSHVDPRGQGEFSFDMEEPERETRPVPSPLEVDDSARTRVLTALGAAPVELDELIRYTGLEPRAVHVIVLELELAGRVERHRGQKISLIDAR
ncbi:MAG: DNA-protecting protein DprA [Stappia sp.]|uniref:DNA-processing protein DprA n=1 Tax=Stappia sp. TaxID=1870903 RepID=UPI000C60F2A3|nr:DNA-processing protein DprA [Stappia sp.]MBM18915.1 DNA-protecting protein DprA [Stappia sp.]